MTPMSQLQFITPTRRKVLHSMVDNLSKLPKEKLQAISAKGHAKRWSDNAERDYKIIISNKIGVSIEAIAQRYNISERTVYRIVKK